VRHDDLRRLIDCGLRVVALNLTTILGLQDAALRIGEVALRLAVWLLFRRAGALPVFLQPPFLRCSSDSFRRRISSAAAAPSHRQRGAAGKPRRRYGRQARRIAANVAKLPELVPRCQ